MYLRNSGFTPRRRQGGFIQGAILFALVIIAVVVAAFSLANKDQQNNADTEQARVNATFMLKVGNDLQTAVNRAIADGLPPENLKSASVKLDDSASSATVLNLFDPTLNYMQRPEVPATALFSSSVVQPLTGSDGKGKGGLGQMEKQTVMKDINGSDIGTGAAEAVISVGGLNQDVCKRINTTVNGTLVTATPPSTFAAAIAADSASGKKAWREGCYGATTAPPYFVYFRTVATDVADKAET